MIAYLLNNICNYYTKTRGCGHSATTIEGAKNSPDAVVVASLPAINYLCKKYEDQQIAFVPLHNISFYGYNRPIVFDNSAIHALCREALNAIDELKLDNTQLIADNVALQRNVDNLQRETQLMQKF